jgi:hypothetical protein
MIRRIRTSSAAAAPVSRGCRSSPKATTVATEACWRVQWEKRAGKRNHGYFNIFSKTIMYFNIMVKWFSLLEARVSDRGLLRNSYSLG